ncbi:MAG: helix-turn-helix transcriptional regulator [Alphaproteobacteria bacterium]|nr:helix-turn-helix transcriptional regulator [Alphaproteobacteria bacterium]
MVAEKAKPLPREENRRGPCAAELHQGYLSVLGERVRNLRARRGMTRKILARDSGVSERYLAQLESGQGNISIGLLRQVAGAMSVPLEDLVREGREQPIELTLLIQRLERLGPEDVADVHRLVAERFGRDSDAHRNSRVALIGLRGAGKTTLGRMLAQHIEVPFVEMHKEIERDSGMSLSEIFSLSGQSAYRRYERRALERVIDEYPRAVIATGGSLVSEPGTFDLLLSACYTIWIKASPEEHMSRTMAQGDLRPMSGNAEAMDDLRRILAERDALYAKADAMVDTSKNTVGQSFDRLVAFVNGEASASRE